MTLTSVCFWLTGSLAELAALLLQVESVFLSVLLFEHSGLARFEWLPRYALGRDVKVLITLSFRLAA